MPYKNLTEPCPECGRPKSRRAKICKQCVVPYVRDAAWRKNMSEKLKGVPNLALKGIKRPDASKRMKAWWTPERRIEQRLAKRAWWVDRGVSGPLPPYYGMSVLEAKEIREAAGCCDECGGDGTESRLHVHHIDRDTHNHKMSNLAVLCHRCHAGEHVRLRRLDRETSI